MPGAAAHDALSWLAAGGLDGHGVAMLALTAIVFAVFAWDRVHIASVCLALLVVLPLFFSAFPYAVDGKAFDPGRFFSGFGHPALVTICSLMILGHALVVTGALDPLARRLAALVASRPRLALAAVLVGVMLVSGFVNDTPVVVLMIPLLLAATARAKISAASVLMPMNFAVLIGGMSTSIGTSTNLIVNSIASSLGLAPFGLLSFYGIVAVAAVPALLYLWLVAPRLLRSVPTGEAAPTEDAFDAELRLKPDSKFVDKELREAVKATGGRMRILDLRDERGRPRSRLPTMLLRAGDRITLQDTVSNLKEFESVLGAVPHHLPDDDEDPAADAGEARDNEKAGDSPAATGQLGTKEEKGSPRHADAVVAQLVVTPQSPLVGRSIRGLNVADRYRLAAVGLKPAQVEMLLPLAGQAWQRARSAFGASGAAATPRSRPDIADRTLATGDVLLLQGRVAALQDAQRDGLGALLDATLVLPRQHKATLALITMAIVIAVAATKLAPIAVAALAGVLVLVASRALAFSEAGAALSVKVILLVAASFALGDALTLTGGTTWLAGRLVEWTGGLAPRWILVLLMLLMGVLTNFVSNNAAAAIGTPLAIELARKLGVPPEPYVLAVLFGCNLCYLTPMGYQTN
ncbi:MAG: SLC13 family permease, partial [Caldimonas sp.]